MLSIGPVASAGAASNYFAKDNYYTKSQGLGPSEWYGQGADKLGLSASNGSLRLEQNGVIREVDAKDFRDVLEGRVEDDRVGYENKDKEWVHNPGKDLVFSPSKSVSVMALVGEDKRIITALQESVKETLDYAERNYASVQEKQPDKSVASRKTGNITAALFTHDTSRNQDPLLHVHAVIANVSYDDKSDSWKSLWMRPFYENRFQLSEMQDSILEKKLQALGYETERKAGKHVEIKSVPEKVRKEFSSRRAEIEEHMQDSATWGQRQVSTYETRAGKTELNREELTKVWQDVALEKGFDAKAFVPEVTKTQTASISKPEEYKSRLVGDSVRHLTTNNMTLTRLELVRDVQRRADHHISTNEIEDTIDSFVDKGGLVVHGQSHTGEISYVTSTSIATEKEIVNRLEASKNTAAITRSKAAVHRMMEGSTLSPTQKDTVAGMLTSKGRYIGVQGWAGTGKTYAVGRATAALKQLAPKKYGRDIQIHGLAPTKNAAKQLSEDLGAETHTLQYFLAKHTDVANGYEPSQESIKKYRGQIITVDESSMVSNNDMKKLMTIADKLEVRKVFFVGDVQQHEAVQAGPAFRLLQTRGMPVHKVTEIRRQKDEPRLLQAAEHAAQGNMGDFFKAIDPDIREGEGYIKDAAAEYVSARSNGHGPNDVILVSPDNRTRTAVSNEIRAQLQQTGKLDPRNHDHTVLRPTYLSPADASRPQSYNKGDSLVFNRDLPSQGIKRGDTFKISNIDTENRTLKLTDGVKSKDWSLKRYTKDTPFEHMKTETLKISKGDEIKFKNEDDRHKLEREQTAKITGINPKSITVQHSDGRRIVIKHTDKASKIIDHAYTSTTYSAQGLTRKTSIMVAQPKTKALSEVSAYIGMTRASQKFRLFTPDKNAMIDQVRSNKGQDVHALDAQGLTSKPKDLTKGLTKPIDRQKDQAASRPAPAQTRGFSR